MSSEIQKADGANELRFNRTQGSYSKRKNSFAIVILAIIVVTLFVVLAPVISSNVPGGGVVGGHIQAYASISFVLTGSFGVTYWHGVFFWGHPVTPYP